jgi:hypothetical protein
LPKNIPEKGCFLTFPFDEMISSMLDPEMIEGTVKIGNEATKDKIQMNLTVNNRASGNAALIARKIAARLHKERQQRLFWINFYP